MMFVTGCNSSDNEDEKSVKTPAAVSRSLESTLLPIQTQSPCNKGENQTSGLTLGGIIRKAGFLSEKLISCFDCLLIITQFKILQH